jgi:hypothetical protein
MPKKYNFDTPKYFLLNLSKKEAGGGEARER